MPVTPSRRDFLKTVASAGAGLAVTALSGSAAPAAGRPRARGDYVGGLVAPKLETVRCGFIGVGARGTGHVRQMLGPERAARLCTKAGRAAPELYTKGDLDYRRMVERDDLDAVIIATPWRWHAPQGVDTMLAGKHAFIEVPIAVTLEECWQLVDTAEKTQRHCMMMENVCYGREELMFLNMCRQGLLGELLHGEAAYIHDLRGQMKQTEHGTGFWRTPHHTRRNGNLYPTHGLGPIAQYMSIDRRDDRFDFLVSLSTPARGRQLFARANFPPDHPRNQARYICGDLNTSLIKTVKGRTILVQHDTTTPRPYTRHDLIQGTRGVLAGFPARLAIEGRGNTHGWTERDGLKPYFDEFDHPLWRRTGEAARKAGGHGGMDFVMLWRMVYCLRNGEPLDQNVYEGCSWSAVAALSEQSVAGGGKPAAFPDFTRGRWKETAPLGIVS
jgi:hypothetical protein